MTFIQEVEQEGFDVFPDWYSSLDRIHNITDMALVSAQPEPFVGDAHRAGAPGLSYLIAKNSASSNCVPTAGEEEARIQAHEALMARYQNRLLVTTLPGKIPVGEAAD